MLWLTKPGGFGRAETGVKRLISWWLDSGQVRLIPHSSGVLELQWSLMISRLLVTRHCSEKEKKLMETKHIFFKNCPFKGMCGWIKNLYWKISLIFLFLFRNLPFLIFLFLFLLYVNVAHLIVLFSVNCLDWELVVAVWE